MIEPQQRDWRIIVAQVLEWANLTQYKLSVLLSVDKKTVAGYLEGVQPRHWQGELLLALHARYRPKPAAEPMRRENAPMSSTLAST